MRLIDADELLEDVRQNSQSYWADDFAYEWVNRQPTVDAVPVEWMRQFKDAPVTEESAKRCDECGGDFVEWMILEWAERKEE